MTERADIYSVDNAPPPGTFPAHDWEEIFECPENGFIPLVKKARTIDGLRDCTHLIIRSLFTRDDDAPIRKTYEQALDSMLPPTGVDVPAMDKGVSGIIQLLREIKMYRQNKAEEHQQQINEPFSENQKNLEPERRETGEPKPLPGLEISESFSADHAHQDDEKAIQDIFADLLCQRIRQRLDVLNQRVTDDRPPFILSKEFAAHYDTLIRSHFAPAFLAESRALVSRTLLQDPDKRRDYLAEQFNGRVTSENLWDRWKDTWDALIHEQELPRRPEPQKKTGLLGSLKKKKKKTPAFLRPMTVEEWEARCKKIKTGNKKARELWALMALESDTYLAPVYEDETLLMNLFARSASGLQNHINALSQIAIQGNDIGKTLSMYAQGKDIDLPLLATCYQFRDLFLGPKKGLQGMLVGLDDFEIKQAYPLVKRFLL